MVAQISSSIRTVREEDRQKLANLIHFEALVHRHLDWRPPLDWIGSEPYLVADKDRDLIAALACPPDPPGIAWIRLFAVSSDINAKEAWSALWSLARARLASSDEGIRVAAIPLQEWFAKLLRASGFIPTTEVIMLLWKGNALPPERKAQDITIRPMNLDDLEHVEALDHLAFKPLWRNSRQALELAYRQAAVATVAEMDQKIIAYEISTANHLGGHLARLAVHPDYQSIGIGYAVLRDMLAQFERRGAKHISVNTQSDNETSLALYRKAGFQQTGEKFSVYEYHFSQ
jgi:ribosomal protein S18 acetylase RimI-like enzyme